MYIPGRHAGIRTLILIKNIDPVLATDGALQTLVTKAQRSGRGQCCLQNLGCKFGSNLKDAAQEMTHARLHLAS